MKKVNKFNYWERRALTIDDKEDRKLFCILILSWLTIMIVSLAGLLLS